MMIGLVASVELDSSALHRREKLEKKASRLLPVLASCVNAMHSLSSSKARAEGRAYLAARSFRR